MSRDAMRQVQAFQCQQQQQPANEPAERDIAVDPFSLRQFSRLDFDRPLPIPSVSVADPHVSPARFGAPSASAASSPRVSIAGRLNALAEATGGWDDHAASPSQQAAPSAAVATGGRRKSGDEAADGATFDVALSSSSGRKASEPQRWGSDVPLISAAGDDDSAGYSFPNARSKNGKAGRRAAGDAPFGCCMYVPGLSSRRTGRPPPPARSSSSSVTFGRSAAAAAEKQHQSTVAETHHQYTVTLEKEKQNHQYAAAVDLAGTAARQSTVSVAASLERFDCGSLSMSSWDDLDLDGEVSSYSSRFDLLPLELVDLGGDDEADLPVCAAFVFDRDVIRRSVLKKRLADDSGAGEAAAPRPSLGRASSGRVSPARVSLKSRSPASP
ncbi:hypothetical protein QOZ80_7BG0599610 [Eleusine coracana subsp. coracana]|nr:hypothetical protein QOZ80_7BG0599610 [Eleusine coracana subsp. coracana]